MKRGCVTQYSLFSIFPLCKRKSTVMLGVSCHILLWNVSPLPKRRSLPPSLYLLVSDIFYLLKYFWFLSDEWRAEVPLLNCHSARWSFAQSFSCVQVFATPWTVAHQAHLSIGFSRQKYSWGCHFFLQGISLDQESNHVSCIGRQIFNHCATWPLQGSVSTSEQPRFGTVPDLKDFLI